VEDILPLEYGPECGDLHINACKQTPGCLWLVHEQECDELKEMDCQDFRTKADCDRAVTRNWVFDEVKFVCLEMKEVDSGNFLPVPPFQLRETNPRQAEAFQWDPVYAYSLAGGFLAGVCFGTLLYAAFWSKPADDTPLTNSYDIMLDVAPANANV